MLNWSPDLPVPSQSIYGYYVIVTRVSGPDLVEAYTLQTSGYTVNENLSDGVQYKWRVANYHYENHTFHNWTDWRYFTYKETPDAPTGFEVSGSPGNSPLLSWDANDEDDLDGYNVYRDVGNGYSKINSNLVTNTYYTDAVTIVRTGGVQTYYRVTAVDEDDNESNPSNSDYINQGTVYPAQKEKAKDLTDLSDKVTISENYIKNYPNPFNPETCICFALQQHGYVELNIYNIKGQRVRSLVNDNKSEGLYNVIWNGKNDFGTDVVAGLYFCRIDTDNFHKNIKLLLVR